MLDARCQSILQKIPYGGNNIECDINTKFKKKTYPLNQDRQLVEWRTDGGRVCREQVSRWQCHLAQNGRDGFQRSILRIWLIFLKWLN
jgi:hypothetical protein